MKPIAKPVLELLGAICFYLVLSAALTWPAIANMDSILLGGGELGGWLWRGWWHFEEIRALYETELGLLGSLEAMISLGRFPETGNILDVILLSYPLRNWFGFPVDHNMKILVILVGNGLCGYALARIYTDSLLVSLAAGSVAIINPLVIQDINKLGLRQVTLWWILLFPIFVQRAERTGKRTDGALVGIFFTLTAAFYWFYGLFLALFAVIWFVGWLIQERPPFSFAFRWVSSALVTASVGIFFFLLPYFSAGESNSGKGGTERLPEVTFLLPYPSYDTIASAPQRPTNYRENVLSSLHRGIDSAWPADYVLDPRHGVLAFPVAVFLVGVLPAVFLRKSRMWLAVWMVFWLGSLGPFLKFGAQKDTSDVVMFADYVVRLPYCFMFQFIPGMSRMFAPYRLSSLVVVASVALVAIALDHLRSDHRRYAAFFFTTAVVLQPFYRFDLGPVDDFNARPSMWRVPIQVSAMRLPGWYGDLDPAGWEGIIELPLEQQQDLLCAYQSFHHRKVYRSWATMPAVPPWIRESGGGEMGRRLRWLAKSPPKGDPLEEVFRNLSRSESEASLENFGEQGLQDLMESGSYRWLNVHERGYFLVDPNQGSILYRSVVRQLEELLGMESLQVVEQEAFEWAGKSRNFPAGPAWMPWASQEVQKPTQDMPDRYFMAVFDLHSWDGFKDSD
jgi:hypothetical protein